MQNPSLTAAIENFASPHPLTVAQRILGQYHTACRDLQAALLGVTDEAAAQAPAEGEWSLRQALAHIIQIDKTLVMLDLPPSEARRLLRMVYNAQAAVESAAIGDENFGLERQNALAVEIEGRTAEIMKIVQ
jgi:hypothetical protein